ncbi:MAG TPA: P63C domain-containing protein [Myxococcales bacterium]
MAIKAGIFLSACAKVGLDAMIDEATGYQYYRAEDALRVKLKAYLADEMRKWEKTFPEDLWLEFGRLTGWKGPVTKMSPPAAEGTISTGITGTQAHGTSVQSGLPPFPESTCLE